MEELEDVIRSLKDAESYVERTIDCLLDVRDGLGESSQYIEDFISETISSLDDVGCDIRKIKRVLEKGVST